MKNFKATLEKRLQIKKEIKSECPDLIEALKRRRQEYSETSKECFIASVLESIRFVEAKVGEEIDIELYNSVFKEIVSEICDELEIGKRFI